MIDWVAVWEKYARSPLHSEPHPIPRCRPCDYRYRCGPWGYFCAVSGIRVIVRSGAMWLMRTPSMTSRMVPGLVEFMLISTGVLRSGSGYWLVASASACTLEKPTESLTSRRPSQTQSTFICCQELLS